MSQLTSADLCYVNKLSAGRISSPILGTYVSRDPGRYRFLDCSLKQPPWRLGLVSRFQSQKASMEAGLNVLNPRNSETKKIQIAIHYCAIF